MIGLESTYALIPVDTVAAASASHPVAAAAVTVSAGDLSSGSGPLVLSIAEATAPPDTETTSNGPLKPTVEQANAPSSSRALRRSHTARADTDPAISLHA